MNLKPDVLRGQMEPDVIQPKVRGLRTGWNLIHESSMRPIGKFTDVRYENGGLRVTMRFNPGERERIIHETEEECKRVLGLKP